MKRILISSLAVAGLVLGGLQGPWIPSPAQAAKPVDVIQWSNGFPSGPHLTLNVHGKKADFATSETCTDGLPGGGSVFIGEGTTSTAAESEIQLRAKKGLTELTAIDECSFAATGDPALVEMPSGIEYQVYARALGKPAQKGSTAPKVIFFPKLLGACKYASTDLNGDGVVDENDLDCLIGLGTTTFDSTGETLERTRGKNTATDITALFQASFSACYESADQDGDGDVDLDDVILSDTDGVGVQGDLDGDGLVDADDLAIYVANPLNCVTYSNASIFTIADLITYGWDVANYGTKLVNVRFYDPRSTAFSK